MKNIVKINLLLLGIINLGCASTKVSKSSSYEKVFILENGIKRSVKVQSSFLKTKSNIATHIQNKDSKDGVIVRFKDDSKVSINSFEQRYSLKLKTKLIVGYYIFENDSIKSDIDIVSDILSNETNIKTVKPNWKLRNVTY